MNVTSLGHRTDLALLRLGGTLVQDRGDHLVVRSPHNPAHWWGNFLLLPAVPAPRDTAAWLDRFAAEFPDAEHVALGFDGVDDRPDALTALTGHGLHAAATTVMTATAVHLPRHCDRRATCRPLTSDADWEQAVELQVLCHQHDDGGDPADHRVFATAKALTDRRLVEAGHGARFGAFTDGLLVAQAGLFTAEPGLVRFQSVQTHPGFRGRGLAATLVHRLGHHGFDALGAVTLVMVVDPGHPAIRLYRSLGFTGSQAQLQAHRPPAHGPA
ncbi:GNAT family N-acetyltransferase [Umezawaea beigongshangensis]|uniref:GNAT family N-acetyltransferase n=1 Tax=Umezawaea beigongshangensis TaxID=2780383 RepID=UPI0018F1F4B6|nr:GNAT family N-acetyltransferase [Umezawaea beigongshangensis]